MVFSYNNREYNVVVVKKNNKNTYIRIKDGYIYVTTNFFSSKRMIEKLLRDNYSYICKMIDKYEKQLKNSSDFYLFGI